MNISNSCLWFKAVKHYSSICAMHISHAVILFLLVITLVTFQYFLHMPRMNHRWKLVQWNQINVIWTRANKYWILSRTFAISSNSCCCDGKKSVCIHSTHFCFKIQPKIWMTEFDFHCGRIVIFFLSPSPSL